MFDIDKSGTLEFGEFLTMMSTSPFFAFNQHETTIKKIHPEVTQRTHMSGYNGMYLGCIFWIGSLIVMP